MTVQRTSRDPRARARAARLEEARRVFREIIGLDLQRALTVELAETRRQELLRAYDSLRAVGAGFRLRRKRRSSPRALIAEPCVVLVVDEKKGSKAIATADHLPRELLCYVEVNGQRRCCAVPTDIDDLVAHGRAKLRNGPSGFIRVTRSGQDDLPGSIACAIVSEDRPGRTFLVSCRHVLSGRNFMRPPSEGGVSSPGGGAEFARVMASMRGRCGNNVVSCDVQLAEVTDAAAAARALAHLRFSGVADGPLDIPAPPTSLWILTPDGPIEVLLQSVHEDASQIFWDYGFEGADKVHHESLIVVKFAGSTRIRQGHSGSPLTTAKDGGVLLGMLIAEKLDPPGAYVIPAWELMSPDNYLGADPTEPWEILLSPDDFQAPAPPLPPPAVQALGLLSQRFETGGRGPGTVSHGKGDRGGVSYGSYQMKSLPSGGTVKTYVSGQGFTWHDQFTDRPPGKPEFTQAWRLLAEQERDRFHDSQHEFIKKTHFDLLVEKVRREDGIDILTRSPAVQDVIWSTAVHHGGNTDVVHRAIIAVGGRAQLEPADRQNDARLISAIYAERGRRNPDGTLVHFSGNPRRTQDAVAQRFVDEEQEALRMLG